MLLYLPSVYEYVYEWVECNETTSKQLFLLSFNYFRVHFFYKLDWFSQTSGLRTVEQRRRRRLEFFIIVSWDILNL